MKIEINHTELRKRLKRYSKEHERIFALWQENGFQHPPPKFPDYPEECKNMTCGAKTRAGHPCKSKAIFSNGRCKFHGGLSTGPKTLEGRRKSALNIGKDYDVLLAIKMKKKEFSDQYARARM